MIWNGPRRVNGREPVRPSSAHWLIGRTEGGVMTRLWLWLTFWLCLLCLAAPAGAQPLVTATEDYWLSVGGGGGVIFTPGDEFFEAAPTVLARLNLSSR